MQPILRTLRQRGSVMRARINLPVFERRASHGSGSTAWKELRDRVIAYVRREYVTPHRGHAAIGVARERDAAALAAVVRQLVITPKRRAAIVGYRKVDGRSAIGRRLCRCGGRKIAFINPRDDYLALGIDRN